MQTGAVEQVRSDAAAVQLPRLAVRALVPLAIGAAIALTPVPAGLSADARVEYRAAGVAIDVA